MEADDLIAAGFQPCLPGLSNIARPVRAPAVTGGPGHGCGHNLIAAANIAAAVAVARFLRETGHPGQVVVFGTPAEEVLTGKLTMHRRPVRRRRRAAHQPRRLPERRAVPALHGRGQRRVRLHRPAGSYRLGGVRQRAGRGGVVRRHHGAPAVTPAARCVDRARPALPDSGHAERRARADTCLVLPASSRIWPGTGLLRATDQLGTVGGAIGRRRCDTDPARRNPRLSAERRIGTAARPLPAHHWGRPGQHKTYSK